RVEADSESMIRNGNRMLGGQQLVAREFVADLRLQARARRVLIVTQLVHPLVPDVAQVLLIPLGPEGRSQIHLATRLRYEFLEAVQCPAGAWRQTVEIDHWADAGHSLKLERVRVANRWERRHA